MSSHFLRYFSFDPFILAGNEDMHKSLHEFEIRPDLTNGFHGNSVIIMKTVLPLFLGCS